MSGETGSFVDMTDGSFTMHSTSTQVRRLFVGAALAGAVVASAGGAAHAAAPVGHRLHLHRMSAASTAPRGSVTLGSAVAFVKAPNGTVHAVTPSSLLR